MKKNVLKIVVILLVSSSISVYSQNNNDKKEKTGNFNDCNCEIADFSYCGYCGGLLYCEFAGFEAPKSARPLFTYRCRNQNCNDKHKGHLHKRLKAETKRFHICKEATCCKITNDKGKKICENVCVVKKTFDVHFKKGDEKILGGTLKPGEKIICTSGTIIICPHNKKFKCLQGY